MHDPIIPIDIAVVSLDLLFGVDHLNSLSRRLPDRTVRDFSTVLEAVARLTPGHPAVILVGPSPEPDPNLLEHVLQAKLAPEVSVVFALDDPDGDLGGAIRESLGTEPLAALAADEIDDAVDAALLRAEEVARQAPRPGPPGDFSLTTAPRDDLRLIVVTGAKGGTGRTTAAVNLATALARRDGDRVALIDAHKTVGDVELLLGLERPDYTDGTDIDDFEIDADSVGRLLRTHGPTQLRVFIPPSATATTGTLSVEQILRLLVGIEEHVDVAVVDAPLALVEAAELHRYSDAVLLVTTQLLPSIKNTRIARDVLDRHESLAIVMNETAPNGGGADESTVEAMLQVRVLAELPWDETIAEGSWARPASGLSKARSGYTKRIEQLAAHLRDHSLVR